MTVTSDSEGVGKGVALFDEDLVADAATGGIEVNGMSAGESLYGSILGEVLGRLVLDIVVEGEYKLPGIVDASCAYGLESFGKEIRSTKEELELQTPVRV